MSGKKPLTSCSMLLQEASALCTNIHIIFLFIPLPNC